MPAVASGLSPAILYTRRSRLLETSISVKAGELVNFVVPTGNFGNILAAYYAKNMGVPVGKLICASNENKVLFDFFETGIYDKTHLKAVLHMNKHNIQPVAQDVLY